MNDSQIDLCAKPADLARSLVDTWQDIPQLFTFFPNQYPWIQALHPFNLPTMSFPRIDIVLRRAVEFRRQTRFWEGPMEKVDKSSSPAISMTIPLIYGHAHAHAWFWRGKWGLSVYLHPKNRKLTFLTFQKEIWALVWQIIRQHETNDKICRALSPKDSCPLEKLKIGRKEALSDYFFLLLNIASPRRPFRSWSLLWFSRISSSATHSIRSTNALFLSEAHLVMPVSSFW